MAGNEIKSQNYNGITQGTIWKQLLLFFFPILLGSLFQQLYNTVDAVLVGQILGKEALAAVGGGTATAINLIIGFFVGLSSGATVIISQYFGANDENKVSLAIHNAAAISLWGGILISVAGYFTSEPLLRIMGTPDSIFSMSLDYMKIYFGGSIFLVMYNMGSGVFRAFGDSRRPFYFLIAGSIANIILDLLFVGVFHMGVKGAAYATVISQAVSLFFVVYCLRKKTDCCLLEYNKIRFDKMMLKKTFAIGMPAAFQSVLYSVSNMIVQSYVNGFGTDTAAAWAAYGKIDTVNWLVINSFGIAITTFVGQNYGAGLMDRAKKGVRKCLEMSFASIAAVEILFLTAGRYGLMLFVTDENVLSIGMQLINSISPFYVCYVCVEILSGAIRGTGRTVFTTLSTVFGICGFRMAYLAIAPRYFHTIPSVMACYGLSWTLTSVLLIIYYAKAKLFK